VSPAPWPSLVGTWKLELLEGGPDGPVKVLQQWQSSERPDAPRPGFTNLVLVGWDASGPMVLVDGALGTQGSTLAGMRIFRGHLSHLDAAGNFRDAITGDDCLPYSVSSTAIICFGSAPNSSSFKALSTSGQTIWDWTPVQPATRGDFALAPDGRSMAMKGAIMARDGSVRPLAPNFHPQGWIDAQTLFGRLGDANNASGNAATVALADPSKLTDLTFKGDLVGTLGG
jgi:hypothetical protein